MTVQELVIRKSNGVGLILLNRPDKMNAWTPTMEQGLRDQLLNWSEDKDVRVILISGNGKAFCSGVDISYLTAVSRPGTEAPNRPSTNTNENNSISNDDSTKEKFKYSSSDDQIATTKSEDRSRYSYMRQVQQPIICAMNGATAGVGLVIALYSDIRIAAKSAKLAAIFNRRGLVAEHGIAWLLPRLVGQSRTTEWLISGRTLDSSEAEQFGITSRTFEDDGFTETAIKYAENIATNCSPRSNKIIKRQLNLGLEQSFQESIEMAGKEVSECFKSEDFKEGVLHFIEKRPPAFSGN